MDIGKWDLRKHVRKWISSNRCDAEPTPNVERVVVETHGQQESVKILHTVVPAVYASTRVDSLQVRCYMSIGQGDGEGARWGMPYCNVKEE